MSGHARRCANVVVECGQSNPLLFGYGILEGTPAEVRFDYNSRVALTLTRTRLTCYPIAAAQDRSPWHLRTG